MKRIVFAIALLLSFAGPIFAQGTASLASNPLAGSITATSSACATASSCVWMKMPPNTGSVSVVVSGTFSATLIAEQSADSVNFIALPGTLVAGTTVYSVSGMTDVRVRASAYTSGQAQINLQASGVVLSGNIVSSASGSGAGTTDPCINPSVAKQSVAIGITTATTTQLVAPSGTKTLYPCGFVVSMVATTAANTVQFTTGSGATCGTSTINLTGVISSGILANGSTVVSYNTPMQPSIAGGGLCAITTVGTGPSIAGTFTYILL